MDWYKDVTERGRPVNPVALDLMQTVHSIARENAHRVRYTKTVEALYTAMSWNQAPPAREDWRVWQTLDQLHLTEHDVARFTDKARQAYYLGGVLVCMLTPEVLDGVLNAGVSVKFISPTPATFGAYDLEETKASLYGSFENGVVTSWAGPASKKSSWYGMEVAGMDLPDPKVVLPHALSCPLPTKAATLWMMGHKFVEADDIAGGFFGTGDKGHLIGLRPWDFSPEFQPGGRNSDVYAKEVISRAYCGETGRFLWRHLNAAGTRFDVNVHLRVAEHSGVHLLQVAWEPILKEMTFAPVVASVQPPAPWAI